MSDALQFLLKARPEAMKSYFRFAREAGQHLDPKTRSLISVITKVAGRTESGLRQYLTRAIREGVSADEIIDALLMAFPVLGLSKVIWAIEIIIEMDIPEFSLDSLAREPEWHDIICIDDLENSSTTYLVCDGRALFVRKLDDAIHVFDSRCPHQTTNIPEHCLTGERLTCPKHGWVFDINSGECIEKGNRPLRQFDTRIEKNRLSAFW